MPGKKGSNSRAQSVTIVGIGASAGGLEALNALVKSIPAQSGIAFVIIQHLSPDHPSMMDKLLSTHTKVPVAKIEDGAEIRADHIYVLPAGPSATIHKNSFKLHDREPEHGVRTPIDQFFQSLAHEKGREAFAVVLSGTGSDGTQGVRAVKNAGGFAIVQESNSAQFPGMPESAAATGMVDLSLPPSQIPGRLIDILHHRRSMESAAGSERFSEKIQKALPEILELIDGADGQDFSHYKPGTLVRRIERRMTLIRSPSIEAFVDLLRNDPDERRSLLNDFLIGVTTFFRDDDFFVSLNQEAILPLLNRDQNSFRIWVPGCATGEEAYSIAMLMAEGMRAANDPRQWQIFGTDIDAAALRHARTGIYTDGQLEGLSQSRREQFLTGVDGRHQIHPTIRERCVFAPHNLLQDPPFSRLDLISCRNLMIYLNPQIQSTIIPRFHYALNDGGFLFLGPSESLGKNDRFFNTIDREARLFRRNDEQQPSFSTLNTTAKDAIRREQRLIRTPVLKKSNTRNPMEQNFEQKLLNFFARQAAPAFATVNSSDEVSFLSERMARYIRPVQGEPSAALDQFLTRDLRVHVRSAVSDARDKGETVRIDNVILGTDATAEVVDVEAQPLPFSEGSVLVTLQPVRVQDPSALSGAADERTQAERELIERELIVTRKQLSATLAEYETTEQELKSSNEELLSMNEELQSSNEELETSREELQSINEELETVNAELTENNSQLMEANSDLKNLFESTEIATVFLDQALCVRRYTPASRRLFAVQDRDVGRPLNDLKWKVSYENLETDAASVTETLQPIERELVVPITEETFLMRIRPYRRTDDRIDGTVLTFFDITARKNAERQLRENADTLARQFAELETLYNATPVGLSLANRDLEYLRINERMAEINGLSAEDHIGRKQAEVVPDIDDKIRDIQQRVLDTGEPALGTEVSGVTPADPGVERHWLVDYYPVRKGSEIFALGTCVQDVTEQKRLQKMVEENAARLSFALETSRLGAWELDVKTGDAERSKLHDEIFGYDELLPEWSYEIFIDHVLEDDREMVEKKFKEAIEKATPWRFQCRICTPDGELRWIQANGRPVWDGESDEATRFMGTVQDITARKHAETQQTLLLHELQHRVKNTMATVIAIVRFSAKRASDLEQFSETLQNRLQAISRTHDVLTSNEWHGETLSDIIRREVEPFLEDPEKSFEITGDDPLLTSKQVLALSLAFHELTTNAAKYGAFSQAGGRVSVKSVLSENKRLKLVWRETDGPQLSKPSDQDVGFGSFLLKTVIGPDLDGSSKIEFRKKGLVWRAEFPINDGSLTPFGEE